MANTFLRSKNVGDIVKINENGVAVNYIIVHKGLPGSMYDSSCDGVWLLREKGTEAQVWDGTKYGSYNNNYLTSDIRSWLKGTFFNRFDSRMRETIKTVKIPYKSGVGNDTSTGVLSGSVGMSCKVFLLGGYEVGFTTSDHQGFPVDGAILSYFLHGNSDESAKSRRICQDNSGTATFWWLRSPNIEVDAYPMAVKADGTFHHYMFPYDPRAARPAFILPYDLPVADDGTVSTNSLPTITSDRTGDIGTLTSGLVCKYSVNDVDSADSVNVTLSIDNTTVETFAATKGTQYTYILTGADWLKTTNGTHTFKITASDGKDPSTSTATFTRACRKAMVMMTSALTADDIIRFCSLKIKGALPMDTILKCEVTNNANDASPVWEDCTVKVRSGSVYIFKNKEAENGFAFNFRIFAERGASGIGGYISSVCGGFE